MTKKIFFGKNILKFTYLFVAEYSSIKKITPLQFGVEYSRYSILLGAALLNTKSLKLTNNEHHTHDTLARWILLLTMYSCCVKVYG